MFSSKPMEVQEICFLKPLLHTVVNQNETEVLNTLECLLKLRPDILVQVNTITGLAEFLLNSASKQKNENYNI